jgi:hypothetical protein
MLLLPPKEKIQTTEAMSKIGCSQRIPQTPLPTLSCRHPLSLRAFGYSAALFIQEERHSDGNIL